MSLHPTVSVVMIFFNAERFMEEALASVYAQTYDDWELILVDDGSTDRSTDIALKHARERPIRVRYVQHSGHQNLGMSASRQLGVEQARGIWVAFLDADDVWRPSKLSEQLAILGAEPLAAMLYGAPLYWQGWTCDAADIERDQIVGIGFAADRLFEPPMLLRLTAPLGTGHVPCPSDVVVRRDVVDAVGGFEPAFRGAYEDVAFYVKVYLQQPVFVSSSCWTQYRIHGESCIAVALRTGQYQVSRLFFLNWFEQYLSRRGLAGTDAWTLLQAKLAPYRQALSVSAVAPSHNGGRLCAVPNPVPADSASTTISWGNVNRSTNYLWLAEDGAEEHLLAQGVTGAHEATGIEPGRLYEFRLYADPARRTRLDQLTVTRAINPGVGGESFGSLRRVVPVSRVYGFDRGQPVDRYYIERFLARNAEYIRGRVLEIGGSTYTRRFGGARVTAVDVLHVKGGNREATLVGDLSAGHHLPSGAFDCILLVQTLQLIFDVDAAVRTLSRMLKPGGVLLATFPGISHKGRDEWADVWQWGFTSASAARLFGRVFPADHLTIERHGNVLATTAFLYGLASSELSPGELEYSDDCYEMLIALRAAKPVHPPVNAVAHRSWRRVVDAAIHRASALAQFDVFYGTLERPRAGAIRGPLEISGWTCSRRSPVERVEAFLGDTPLGTLDYGHERPDVAAVFPALPTAAWSGYSKTLSLDRPMCGRQMLVVRATDRRGNSTAFRRRVVL